MNSKVAIIGAGHMGSAIIGGIRKHYSVIVCEQDAKRLSNIKRKYHVASGTLQEAVENSKIILLAVKPQNFDEVLKKVSQLITHDKLIISIAAGITTKCIEKKLGNKPKVVRAMPNLPAQVNQGITGVCLGKWAKNEDIVLACRIFKYVGKVVVVEEKWLDAITATSGSGPAYVFLFIESFLRAAQSLGLKEEKAKNLVFQTVRGSLDLLENQNESAESLRKHVTSKGGTTEAALEVFSKAKFDKIFQNALNAALKRAKKLSR